MPETCQLLPLASILGCKKAALGPSMAPSAKEAWATAFKATPVSISLFTMIANLFSKLILDIFVSLYLQNKNSIFSISPHGHQQHQKKPQPAHTMIDGPGF